MKCRFIKHISSTIILVLALASHYAFASASDCNDPNDPNFVWVVALEKDSPHEVCSDWSPTLYKISVEEARVVGKKKIAEQGAPIFCYSLPGDRIRVVLSEGVAANGTYVAERITIDLTIDKNGMRILKSNTKKGYDDPQEYRNIVLLDKNKNLNIDKPKQFVKKKGDVFLGTSKITPRAFMLKRFLRNNRNLSLEILDSNTLTPIKSMPLNVGNRKLGGFSGADWGDATLIADRFVICLFHGNSSLGTFAPGYVIIVNTASKIVKYVAIGSNPSRGIAY